MMGMQIWFILANLTFNSMKMITNTGFDYAVEGTVLLTFGFSLFKCVFRA